MINFLPILYEDELLYSVIARYQRMCGMISKRAMIKDMFGKFVVLRSSYFPKHLTAFVNNLPSNSKITTDEVIFKHTMLPFHTAFKSDDQVNTIAEKMSNSQGGAIESMLGFGGNKIKVSSFLKYCPNCFEEDLAKLGESYWRRSHQILGSFYCSKHEVLLKESTVSSTGTGLDYICADDEVCDGGLLPDTYPSIIKDMNLTYVRKAEFLMEGNYQHKSKPFIINFYIDRLREKGLSSDKGTLYMTEVESRFLEYYPSTYLKLMQSEVEPQFKNNWLRLFVRKNKGNHSPLRHLLFMQFINVELVDFFNTTTVFGKIADTKTFNPKFDIHERRNKWLKLIDENRNANREELKEIGKGLHTWIYRHDRDWYEKVTPRIKVRKQREKFVDWKAIDEECLQLAKEAVQTIMIMPGKPIRVTSSSITRFVGERDWFRKNKHLVKTKQFMEEAREDINDFRIRKIKWAIEEMSEKEERITPYKVELFAGFGGVGGKEVRKLIETILEES